MHPAPSQLTLLLADEAATGHLAAALAPCVGPGFTLFLSGDLGTGKTAFTRALLRALGHTGRVRSPTFTLAEPYNLSRFDLYHFDFYRFSDENEWRDAGFEESIGGDTAAVVEWPELAGPGLPAPDLWLRLRTTDNESSRIVVLQAHSVRGRTCLNALSDTVKRADLAGVCCWAPSAPPSSA
ncbi:MAG: tRNA (adenosine(37)-N6)-threonylcarbamoyltransferase complex ATPase subunit type 1 TsaE [Burkholderiaceae bacterium]|nr:tRNA (adenosine(37)-N6)-threonylcarbamoyltransferase complex ATPase subunit type 1 TsaE [Burkholderiaceae bacterium]